MLKKHDLKIEQNLWTSSSKEKIETDPLEKETTSDLVIIGGGYTGCSAALHAANSGINVQLIEANTIGYGGSGRNAGLVNAGLWVLPSQVETLLGKETGAKLNTVLAKAPDLVFSLIQQHTIECDAVRSGTLHCAHSIRGLKELEGRYRQLIIRNAPVALLDAVQTEARTGSASFFGSLFDRRAGTINPLAYCRGLARAAQATGAILHESTPALDIQFKDHCWLVTTPRGSIIAKALLIATNAYSLVITGVKTAQYTPVHFFQLATKPLDKITLETLLPGGEGAWDTAPIMSAFRLDGKGRLIIGAIGSLGHRTSSIHTNWAARKLSSLFPKIAQPQFEHHWHGCIAMTRDHIPKIIRLGKHGYAVYGYSGRGIGPGTVFGKAVADALLTNNEDCLPIPPIEQYAESFTVAKEVFYELGASAAHLVGDR